MLTEKQAEEIAELVHAGQYDKIGDPYILHPRWIRDELAREGADEQTRILALLHDTVEDADWVTYDYLRGQGADEELIADLEALTKRPDESKQAAAQRAKLRPRARRVKLKDNDHNSREDRLARLAQLSAKDADRLRRVYAEVRAILLADD